MFKNVLLAIDLAHSEEHQPAIEAAKKYAKEGSNINIISVIPSLSFLVEVQSFLPPNYDKALMEKATADLHEFTKSHLPELDNMKHIVTHGKVYEKINDIANKMNIDLIITMASIKKDKASSGFGPNVARIVRNSNCSVLVLR